MRSTAGKWLAGTLAGLATALAIALWIVRPTYDLAFFLPTPSTPQESVLVERLGQGPGSRLIFLELHGGREETIERQSSRLKTLLTTSDQFLRVENGERELSLDDIPRPIWTRRYLLADVDWSTAGLAAALRERMSDVISLGGVELSRLIAVDPVWAAPRVLERLQFGGSAPAWFEGSGRAFLVAETRAAPFDMDGQNAAIKAIRKAQQDVAPSGSIEMYGVGVYGSRMKDTIQSEAQILGLFATAIALLVITYAYRSWRLTLMSAIPLLSAVLGGIIVSSLVFGEIHGITVAFGATLVGVVDDYPMHLFSHARHTSARHGVRLLWRTLLASASTAVVAYAALVIAGSRGLAQLGVFCVAGILCALTVTCWVLPNLMDGGAEGVHESKGHQQLRHSWRVWVPMLIVAAVVVSTTGGIRWNDNLGELTPVPAAVLARDNVMRHRFGAPDVRYLISITADSESSALERTEAVVEQLNDARSAGLLESWSAVTDLLPSETTQERRRLAIPAPALLEQNLSEARQGIPFRADAFEPFLQDVEQARALPIVRAGDFNGTVLADYVSSHLTERAGQWRSVVFLTRPGAPDRLAEWLRGHNVQADLVDLKAASESLVQGYRTHLISILAASLAVIALLVAWSTRGFSRFIWCAGTVAGSVLLTIVLLNWLRGSVSLFHLVSVVLVAGLGVDYCLFYSRPEVSRTEFEDTKHAVAAGAASTAGAFAILGMSSIPLLSIIGTTVAVGTALTFIAARAGCVQINEAMQS